MLVRFALGQSDTLEPLPGLVAGRFNLWLGREAKAGRTYSDAQIAWLHLIRDYLAVNIAIPPADLMEAPVFADRGGLIGARTAFGLRLPELLDDLTDALVA